MPTITLTLTVPEGTDIQIRPAVIANMTPAAPTTEDVEGYYRLYLSDNGRKLYKYAALAQRSPDYPNGFTLADLAANASVSYESARSWHQTSGRSARRWRDDTGTDAPIQLTAVAYDPADSGSGMRSRYTLPDEVADIVVGLM